LIADQDSGLVQSASAAVLSVSDSNSINPVFLVKVDFPPLAYSFLGVSKLAWSLEGKIWKIVAV
jgi:hypothetical protein